MISYVIGDATYPVGDGPKMIAHVVNNLGKWGAGFTGALSRRWPDLERQYKSWLAGANEIAIPRLFGELLLVQVDTDIWVANLLAQSGVRGRGNPQPIRYSALGEALWNLSTRTKRNWCSVHMPRIGCGLAGGDWARVEPLIAKNLSEVDHIYVYDLPTRF